MSKMKRKIATLTSSIVIGGLLLTGGVVFATNQANTATADSNAKVERFGGPGRHGGFDMMRGQRPGGDNGDKTDFVANLVKDGVITQDIADKINAYTKQKQEDKQKEMAAKQQEVMKNKWDALVKAGVVTQDEADKIIAFRNEQQEARKVEMDKVKNMTADERKAYFESKKDTATKDAKPDKAAPYKELVDAGIITQEKADAIVKAEQAQHEAAQQDMQAKQQEQMKSKLDAIVKDGTITQDQEDKIMAYIAEKQEARKAEMDKVKNMTADERKAYMESNKDTVKKAGIGTELVDKGIITQDQLDAVKKAIGMGFGQGGKGGPRPQDAPAPQQ